MIPKPKSKFWQTTVRMVWLGVFGISAFFMADHIGHYDLVAHIAVFDHGMVGFAGVILSTIFAALYWGFEKGGDTVIGKLWRWIKNR